MQALKDAAVLLILVLGLLSIRIGPRPDLEERPAAVEAPATPAFQPAVSPAAPAEERRLDLIVVHTVKRCPADA